MGERRPPRLSAVIACYKDAQAIPLMHERLSAVFAALAVDHEIIFVNDGSPDDTASVVQVLTAKDHRVLAVEHARNFGSQNAFVSGMELATGDAVILLDGDLQDPPEVIPALYEKWRQGHEVVYGRRSQREGSRMMAMAARAFYRVFHRLSDVPVPLDAGDFSLIDRRVVDELLRFPEADQFLRGLRAWVGFRQTGVDYVRPERAFGRSTHSRLKNLWWAKKAIFSFSTVPVEALGYLGFGLTLLSSSALVCQLLRARPLTAALVAFFGSLNLLAISVVGEYLIRTFEEVKRRPKFIRRALWQGGTSVNNAADIAAFVERRQAARRAWDAGAG